MGCSGNGATAPGHVHAHDPGGHDVESSLSQRSEVSEFLGLIRLRTVYMRSTGQAPACARGLFILVLLSLPPLGRRWQVLPMGNHLNLSVTTQNDPLLA